MKKILCVEDDMISYKVEESQLKKYLAKHELGGVYEIVHVKDGAKALEAAQANDDIALVLMDLQMPQVDGPQAAKNIHRLPNYGDLPIIAVTAQSVGTIDSDDFVAHVTKHYEAEILFTAIEEYIK